MEGDQPESSERAIASCVAPLCAGMGLRIRDQAAGNGLGPVGMAGAEQRQGIVQVGEDEAAVMDAAFRL
jgi:hypothetical protein